MHCSRDGWDSLRMVEQDGTQCVVCVCARACICGIVRGRRGISPVEGVGLFGEVDPNPRTNGSEAIPRATHSL